MASSHKNIPDQAFDALVSAEAQRLATTPRPDVQAALGAFRERRNDPPARIIPIKRFWPAIAAAAIVLVAAIVVVTQLPSSKVDPLSNNTPAVNTSPTAGWRTITATTPGRTETLPDGSTIQLAPQSSISYPANFTTDRQTRLSGDASFTVTHNPANPFRVQTKDLTITVLGTSFSIATLTGQTKIAVKEGLIEVTRNQYRIHVAAHETLAIPQGSGSWQKFGDTAVKPVPASPADARTSAQPETPRSSTPIDTLKPSSPAKPSSSAKPATAITYDERLDSSLNAMRSILADLVADHCVPDRDHIISATLTPEALIVNDIVQSNFLFEKFKAKYLDNSGNGYYYGSVHITGRGYFFNKTDLDNPPHRREPKTRYDSIIKPRPKPARFVFDSFSTVKPAITRTIYVN